jgi:hypothetical protein
MFDLVDFCRPDYTKGEEKLLLGGRYKLVCHRMVRVIYDSSNDVDG